MTLKLSDWQNENIYPTIAGVYKIISSAPDLIKSQSHYYCYWTGKWWCGGWNTIVDAQQKPKIISAYPQPRKWLGVLDE